MNKYLIAGLGNPGPEYTNTRHNIGFLVLDAFAKASNTSFIPNRLADTAEVKFKGRTLILIKPSTYMNLSGKSVNYWLNQEKISKENLLVITDDIALPYGTLRLKGKGSDGGHNGLKSIIEHLQSTEFARLRFGIGNNFSKGNQADYVLGEWTEEEVKNLPARIETCGEMIKSLVTAGLQLTMTHFNNK